MTQKTSTTDIIVHYLDLNQLQMALQNQGPVEEAVSVFASSLKDSGYIEAKHAFFIAEAERLGISPEGDDKELLIQTTKQVDNYGQQHIEVLSEAISDKDINDSVDRMTYKLTSLVPKAHDKKKEDLHVDNPKDIL